MKQAVLLTLVISLVTFFSCNKKELEENNQFIIGTWEATYESLSGCADAGMDTQGEIECTESDCIRYTFEDSGVYFAEITIDGESFGEQGTFTLDVDQISFCLENEGEVTCTSGSYEVNSVGLNFTITDADSGCSIRREFSKVEPDA